MSVGKILVDDYKNLKDEKDFVFIYLIMSWNELLFIVQYNDKIFRYIGFSVGIR
jgi:hypothetical protein